MAILGGTLSVNDLKNFVTYFLRFLSIFAKKEVILKKNIFQLKHLKKANGPLNHTLNF